MYNIERANGRISFATEIMELLKIAEAYSNSERDIESLKLLINHCEKAIKADEQFINIELQLMESELMLNGR